MNTHSRLAPLLVVRRAADAIDFYVRALGARVLSRYEHGAERRVGRAELSIEGAVFAVTEEARAWNSDAPPSLGGSPVVMQLAVEDTDAAVTRTCDAGATVVFPVQELFGERMARVRDPFGHLWLLRQRVEDLSSDEIQRQRNDLFARFAAVEDPSTLSDSGPASQAPRFHLILGPVGAGKSTFALGLAAEQGAIRLTLDQWMAELFSPDRPEAGILDWYRERAARCVTQIFAVAKPVLEAGTSVVLELGLLQRRERERFYALVDEARIAMTIHVLDAARDVRRKRVAERNRLRGTTFSMLVPPAVFELASDFWEPLEPEEYDGRNVRFIRTDSAPT